MPDSEHLVNSYVDILNLAAIRLPEQIFAIEYRDLDPLRLPGVFTPAFGSSGGLDDIRRLVSFLQEPGVDIHFTLEDVLSGSPDRVGYRLFGEGTVPIADAESDDGPNPNRVKKLAIPNTSLNIQGLTPDTGNLISDKLHVRYKCVGIFQVRNSKLYRRWGRASVD